MVTPAAALDPSKSASHFIEVYGFFKWERWRREFFLVGGSLPLHRSGRGRRIELPLRSFSIGEAR
jgi:hypothetical protein